MYWHETVKKKVLQLFHIWEWDLKHCNNSKITSLNSLHSGAILIRLCKLSLLDAAVHIGFKSLTKVHRKIQWNLYN